MTVSSENSRDSGLPTKFRLMTKLGQGGMAQVHLALMSGPSGFHKLVVLKVLRPEFSDDVHFVEMFFEEAKLAAKLSHAQIVQTYEVGGEGGRPYICMEYLDGQPLSNLVQKLTYEKFPLGLYLLVMMDMLGALHYAHEFQDLDGTYLNLVHRDVSPQNVIVTYDGQVKLVDFGIAKAVGSASHTQTGTIKGKLRYVAPEQILTRFADRRVDIFAAGVMLWEVLAQQRLYSGETEASMLHKRATGAEPSVASLNHNAPEAIIAVCAKAMALDPDERYRTALEFQQALEEGIQHSSLQASRRDLIQLAAIAFAEERNAIRAIIEKNGKQIKEDLQKDFAGNDDRTQEFSGAEVSASRLAVSSSTLISALGHGESTEVAVATTFSRGLPRTSWQRIAFLTVFISIIVGIGSYWIKQQVKMISKDTKITSLFVPSSSAEIVSVDKESAAAHGIDFHLTVNPPEALVTLDDVMIPTNRYQGRMIRDGAIHRLRFVHPGYESEERLLRFDNDIFISVSLQHLEVRKTTAPPLAASSHRKKADKSGAETTVPIVPPSNKRTIDEKDPYE